MSRSGYSEDGCEGWDFIRYRGAVNSAIRGRRGQAFLRELLDALDTLEDGRLIAGELIDSESGCVCALGAVAKKRNMDVSGLDPEDIENVAKKFGIADAMAREIVYINDELGYWTCSDTPEERFHKVRKWVLSNIREDRKVGA